MQTLTYNVCIPSSTLVQTYVPSLDVTKLAPIIHSSDDVTQMNYICPKLHASLQAQDAGSPNLTNRLQAEKETFPRSHGTKIVKACFLAYKFASCYPRDKFCDRPHAYLENIVLIIWEVMAQPHARYQTR